MAGEWAQCQRCGGQLYRYFQFDWNPVSRLFDSLIVVAKVVQQKKLSNVGQCESCMGIEVRCGECTRYSQLIHPPTVGRAFRCRHCSKETFFG